MYLINRKIKTKLTLIANKATKGQEKYSYFLEDQKIIFFLMKNIFVFANLIEKFVNYLVNLIEVLMLIK